MSCCILTTDLVKSRLFFITSRLQLFIVLHVKCIASRKPCSVKYVITIELKFMDEHDFKWFESKWSYQRFLIYEHTSGHFNRFELIRIRARITWWRHQMESFSALLAICAWNSPVPGEFPTQRPVTRSFDIYFDLRPNKRLSKQSWGWWFETKSRPLWRHRNELSHPCLYGM